MANINFAKKELVAYRIANRCSFLTEDWEQEWMRNAIRSAFRWAEKHSKTVDEDAPYCIVKAKKNYLGELY